MGATGMAKRFWRRYREAAQTDPVLYSPATSPDRLGSLEYAFAGCAYMLRRQPNSRIILAATLAVTAVALWLRIDAIEWALLILTVASVWIAEFVNAALEAAVNLASEDIHPMAAVAKDVAAGAVLIAAFAAALIGLLILGPPLIDQLQASASAV